MLEAGDSSTVEQVEQVLVGVTPSPQVRRPTERLARFETGRSRNQLVVGGDDDGVRQSVFGNAWCEGLKVAEIISVALADYDIGHCAGDLTDPAGQHLGRRALKHWSAFRLLAALAPRSRDQRIA